MRNNISIMTASMLTIPFFLAACGEQGPPPTKPLITALQTENVNNATHVIHIPGMNPAEATYRDDDKIKAFSFMVAQTTRMINPEAQTETANAPKTEENLFIYFADGKAPYSVHTTRIEPGTYIATFNGDATHPSVQVLFLTSGETGFRAFLLEDRSLAPPAIAIPVSAQKNNDDNGPAFDMTNPAHPLHPMNPMNPTNPSGFFAPRPSNGGK